MVPLRLDFTSLPGERLAHLTEPKIILYSKIDRQHRCVRRQLLRPERQQRRCRDRGSRHFDSGQGEGLGGSPRGDWYGWFPPAVSSAHSRVTVPLLSVLPPSTRLCPGFFRSLPTQLRPSLLSERRRAGFGPARVPETECSPGFPGTPGPKPGFGEGHADPAWPEPLSVQLGLSLACFVFALSQGYFAEGEEFASAFFTRNGPCKSLLE